ncbi:ATP-binding protein [Streptomyces sp. NPDC057375]|uniref:ATP-binding protein n=1 Tax=Streptomyces sp. NPDC057375 TaxID=3346109 RepID=UPI003626F1C6
MGTVTEAAVSRSRTSRLKLCGLDRPVSAARRHAHDVLVAWGVPTELVDNAEIIVSELVTNAVQHAAPDGGAEEFGLSLRHRRLVIAVSDRAPSVPPSPRPECPAGSEAESGRGLCIVAALARAHGCMLSADHKVVWAHLTVPRTSSDIPNAAAA